MGQYAGVLTRDKQINVCFALVLFIFLPISTLPEDTSIQFSYKSNRLVSDQGPLRIHITDNNTIELIFKICTIKLVSKRLSTSWNKLALGKRRSQCADH